MSIYTYKAKVFKLARKMNTLGMFKYLASKNINKNTNKENNGVKHSKDFSPS